MTGNGLVGTVPVENGDCTIEPVADRGVVAVDVVEITGGNAGTGGIVTRRSGDFAFTGLVNVEAAGATRLTGGGLTIVGDVEEASAIGSSSGTDTTGDTSGSGFSTATGDPSVVFCSGVGGSTSIAEPAESPCECSDFLRSSSPT